MKKARICVIGNGVFANSVHYPLLASFGDVELVGIFAFDAGRLRLTAQRYGIPEECVFTLSDRNDYRRHLSRLQPDAIYILGQPDQMLDIWLWCLGNGCNIFIEKPLGLTLHQAEMLAWIAEKNRCITQVSLQRRSAPLLKAMKEACCVRGAITHGVVEFAKFDIRPMAGARDRMFDDFIHCIDTARWICGGEIDRIESHCRRIVVPDINWIGAALYFENGSVCHAVGNWSSGRRVFRVNMHAPGICADVEPEKEAWLYRDGDYEGERFDATTVANSKELHVFGGFRAKHREFIDSVLSGIEKTSSPFSDVLKTMEACETILARYLLYQPKL
jgi:predicted dehydrogenase